MAITRNHNGIDLCGNTIYLSEGEASKLKIGSSPRINIDYAEEYRFKPWRFYVEGSPFVSKG